MEEKKLTVTFVNVGYGEAILLECPDPSRPGGVFTALIDGGSAEESEFADRASGRLPVEERVLLDYVFVTKGAKIDRYRVIQDKPENSYLSDHCPILVELTVQ